MDLQSAAAVLARKKWLIVFSVLLTALLTAGATRLTGATWTGTVKFIAPTMSPLAEAPNEHSGGTQLDSRAQATMYASVVKSLDVVGPALKQLNWARPASGVLNQIEFEPTGERMFSLKVSDGSPARAEQLANALADSFIKRNQDLSTQQARSVADLLESQLKQADANIADVRRRYDAYCAEHKVLGDPGNQLFLVLKRLEASRLNRNEEEARIVQARVRLFGKRNALSRRPAAATFQEAPPPAADSPLMKSLQDELAQQEQQLLILRRRYNDVDPKIAAVLEKQRELQARLQAEEMPQIAPRPLRRASGTAGGTQAGSLDELSQEISGAQAAIATEDENIRQAETEIKKLRDVNSPLTTLASELTSATEARTNLSMRLNSARLALDTAAQQRSLVILERVGVTNPAVNMSAGRSKKLVILAALCALIASGALVLGMDSTDKRLKSAAEVERHLPVRVLAAIPQPLGDVTPAGLARASEVKPLSPHAEAYRFLGRSLLNAPGGKIHAVMALAAKSGQGSTNTLANLGITLAQSGKRVILVDANIRQPRLHQVFGLANAFGLTDALQTADAESGPGADANGGQRGKAARTDASAGLDDVLARAVQPTSVPNLYVLPGGPSSVNPWQLFSGGRLKQVAHSLRQAADYVLYDTPSASAFTDAMNLAAVVDAALLCVRALEPLSGDETRLLEQMEQAGVRILGCVLTDVPPSLLDSFRDHGRATPRPAEPTEAAKAAAPMETAEPAGIASVKATETTASEAVKTTPTEPAAAVITAAEAPQTTVTVPAETTGAKTAGAAAAEPPDAAAPMGAPLLTPTLEAPEAGGAAEISAPADAFPQTARAEEAPDAGVSLHMEEPIVTQSSSNSQSDPSQSNSFQSSSSGEPMPVFPRAFNGYAVPVVDEHIRQIQYRLSATQRLVDQQAAKIDRQAAQINAYTSDAAPLQGRVDEQAATIQQMKAQAEEQSLYASKLVSQLNAQASKAEQLAAELEAAQRQTADMVTNEAAAVQTLMETEQRRARVEQELEEARQAAQAEAEQMTAAARRDAETLTEQAREQAGAIVEAARAQMEQERAQARAQAQQMLTLLQNEAAALLSQARAEAQSETAQQEREQAQAEAQAQAEQIMAQARHEADALLSQARERAAATEDAARKSAAEAQERAAAVSAAHEERMQGLGAECNAIISHIRQALEAQLALLPAPTPTPIAGGVLPLPMEASGRSDERALRGNGWDRGYQC